MATLHRATVIHQIERFLNDEVSPQALAAWAFDQICDREEELLTYEPGYDEVIGAVLDDLMWADEPTFRLDHDTARALQTRLEHAIPQEAPPPDED
jgi:hypothetical protein